MRLVWSVLVLCVLPGWAHAFQWTTWDGPGWAQTSSERVTAQGLLNEAKAKVPPVGATITAGTNGATSIVESWRGPSPKAGEFMDVGVKRSVAWRAVGKAVAKGLPVLGTILVIDEVLDAIRCREKVGGGGECDAGRPQQQETAYIIGRGMVGQSGYFYGASPAAVCAVAAAALAAYESSAQQTTSVLSVQVQGEWPSVLCNPVSMRVCIAGGGCADSVRGPWGVGRTTAMMCPPIPGVPGYPPLGPDGKCPSNIYEPATDDEIADKWESYGDKTKAPSIIPVIYPGVAPLEHPQPEIQPQPVVQGGREVKVNPDGSTTIKEWGWECAGVGDGYNCVPKTVTKTFPPGAAQPLPGELLNPGGGAGAPSQPGDSTSTGTQPAVEVVTCGLPGRPPCKIDETGTPTAQTDDGVAKADGVLSQVKACVLTPSSCLPALPSLNWTFAFPVSCAPIPVGAFGRWMESIDICPFQPLIHDIMSLIWAGVGFFGAIRIIGWNPGG